MAKNITALGIMNGTSLDAVDYSLVEVSSSLKKIVFKKHIQKKIPLALKNQLLSAARDELNTYQVSSLHFDLGRLYAQQIKQLKKSWQWDIVGLHGQTVHHEGKKASLQIGQPCFIKQTTDAPIYFDFRSADIAAGGQGAPFAPFFQKFISPSTKLPVAFHNLGGISNLTLFYNNKVTAFDTGPANILLDAWIFFNKKGNFDRGGLLASQGLPSPTCVNAFLKHPYFNLKTPKSTGREDFNLDFINKWGGRTFRKLNLNDQLATLTELTALSIATSYSKLKHQPQSIYFYGGGIFNSYLMSRIQFNLPQIKLSTTDELGWPSQAFESATFAFLAAARHFKKTVHLPQVTGAKTEVHLGSVYF